MYVQLFIHIFDDNNDGPTKKKQKKSGRRSRTPPMDADGNVELVSLPSFTVFLRRFTRLLNHGGKRSAKRLNKFPSGFLTGFYSY